MVHMATMDVLLVEDDPRIARVVERALTDVGHRVEVARDGLEGLTSAERGGHDLLVLDVMLPEMDGFQLAEQIVQAQPHVPVIFMSGYSEKYLPVRVPISSPASILAKPFPFQTLLLRATHMIMRRPAAAYRPSSATSH
jgi:two-component system copper resistance phosphate regulon response regulator CusR